MRVKQRAQKTEMPESNPHPQIGPYALLQRLGTAHKHAAYRALDTRSGFPVFLKVRAEDPETSDEQSRVFEEFAKRLKRVDEPHLVRLLDVGKESGFRYIVTNFVRGKSLEQLIAGRSPLPEPALARCAIGLASALDVLHRLGLLHCGVTPDHVMIRRDGVVKLCDLTRVRTAGKVGPAFDHTAPSAMRQYAGPEMQTPGLPIDRRTDYYGFGATLYFAAVGRPPFTTKRPERLNKLIQTRKPASPRRRNKRISSETSRLILSLLAKTPAERPSTLEDVCARFQRCVEML